MKYFKTGNVIKIKFNATVSIVTKVDKDYFESMLINENNKIQKMLFEDINEENDIEFIANNIREYIIQSLIKNFNF